MVFRWRFAPGGDIFVTWKDAILGSENSSSTDYFENVGNLLDQPQSNSLSIKIIYFLDYASISRKG